MSGLCAAAAQEDGQRTWTPAVRKPVAAGCVGAMRCGRKHCACVHRFQLPRSQISGRPLRTRMHPSVRHFPEPHVSVPALDTACELHCILLRCPMGS